MFMKEELKKEVIETFKKALLEVDYKYKTVMDAADAASSSVKKYFQVDNDNPRFKDEIIAEGKIHLSDGKEVPLTLREWIVERCMLPIVDIH